MENNNNQDEGPKKKKKKKSHKKTTATIKQVLKDTRKVIAKESAPKTKNLLPKYSNTTRPSGPAGNLQQTHNRRQKFQGVTVDEKNNLGFARADLLTPTKKATDVNKSSRANFAVRKNKTEKKETKKRVSRDNVPIVNITVVYCRQFRTTNHLPHGSD
jgi:hypothetical protein